MKVLVVGGGISGLAGAWEFMQLGHQVTVLEREDQIGGKLQTRIIDGLQVELGPDSYLRRNPLANELIDQLDLQETAPAAGRALLYDATGCQPIPTGLNLGAPKSVAQALANHLVPLPTRARAAIGALWPDPHPTDRSDDLGLIVSRRYGRRWADANIEPLVGGINANTIYGLSALTSAPSIVTPPTGQSGGGRLGPLFAAPSAGLSALVARLEQELTAGGCRLITSSSVQSIERRRACDIVVATSDAIYEANRVLVAVPAFQAAAALATALDGDDALELLRSIHYASVSMSITFTSDTLPARFEGISGVLVARQLGLLTTAVSIASNKWPGTIPHKATLLRISTGSLYDRRHRRMDDDELQRTLTLEARQILDYDLRPQWHRIVRWERAFPHFRPYHRQIISKLDARLRSQLHDDVILTGSYINGSGIPTCIATARERARQMVI